MGTRKNVSALSAAEKSTLINAVLQLKSSGGYNQYVAWHSRAMDLMSAHMGPAFCPWHRGQWNPLASAAAPDTAWQSSSFPKARSNSARSRG